SVPFSRLPTDGCSRAGSLALPEPHLPANLPLGLAVRLLQGSLQFLLVRWLVGLTQTGQHGKIAVNLLNRSLAVVCLFDAQRLAFLPIDRQRFERTDFTTTDDCLHHAHVSPQWSFRSDRSARHFSPSLASRFRRRTR